MTKSKFRSGRPGVAVHRRPIWDKTTTVAKAIEALKLQDGVMALSARRPGDAELIAELPAMQDIGTVIVDDFHRLPDAVKGRLSDYMKVLADSASDKSKLILLSDAMSELLLRAET